MKEEHPKSNKMEKDLEKISISPCWVYHSLGLYNLFCSPKIKGYFYVVSNFHYYPFVVEEEKIKGRVVEEEKIKGMLKVLKENKIIVKKEDIISRNFSKINQINNVNEIIKAGLSDNNCEGIVPITGNIEEILVEQYSCKKIVKGIGTKDLHKSEEIPDRYYIYNKK